MRSARCACCRCSGRAAGWRSLQQAPVHEARRAAITLQGAANDFCRYLGERSNPWWSCALAGAPAGRRQQTTAVGEVKLDLLRPEGMPCNQKPAPRQDLNAIHDKGYGDLPHGWCGADGGRWRLAGCRGSLTEPHKAPRSFTPARPAQV